MIAEILTVGTEILMGEILNTNAQYISQRLADLGITQYHQTTVGDNPKRLTQAFLQAWARADVVILTGGLGPTLDDLTKETVAAALDWPMQLDEHSRLQLEKYFRDSGREMTQNNLRQAVFPVGSTILPNPNGTAPGCRMQREGKVAFVLPGPPREMRPMFEVEVVPYLAQHSDGRLYSRMVRVFGMGESSIEEKIKDIVDAQSNPTIAPYAGFGEVRLRICAKADCQQQADALLAPVEHSIRRRLGANVYATGVVPMEGVVARLLLQRGTKVSVAESCTGGEVASGLVAYPGISACLMEGIVCYSNQSKMLRLGVPADTLAQHGAVSSQTALAMCDGLLRTGLCEVAVSTTGVAGPDGGSPEKPVGCVYIALVGKHTRFVHKFLFGGNDRGRIRRWAAMHAYNLLRLYLLGQEIDAFYAGDCKEGNTL